jgi:hypothetical protein
VRVFVAVAAAAIVAVCVPSVAKANACTSGSHGVYTSILCDGEFLVGAGAYLISPNGNVRSVLGSDGHVATGDFSVDPPTHLYDLYAGSAGAAHRMMVNQTQISGVEGGFFYNSTDTYLGVYFYVDNGSGIVYYKLHDDGCVWGHFSDDSFDTGVCATGA